jgi:hypothetical protein
MAAFKNANFVKRDYEVTNVVAYVADTAAEVAAAAPGAKIVPANGSILLGLTRLWTQGGVTFYGYP